MTYLLLFKLLNLPKIILKNLINIYNNKSKTLLKDYTLLNSKKNYYIFLFSLMYYLLIIRTFFYKSDMSLY
jgi:hypothetical protein